MTDGLSNTIAMSERLRQGHSDYYTVAARELDHRLGYGTVSGVATSPPIVALTLTDGKYFVAGTQVIRRFGSRWARGHCRFAAFNTVLPPNAPTTEDPSDQDSGHYPPSSLHPGGVNVLFADGSVDFVSETIDTGNLGQTQSNTYRGPSRYGVWGALGSKAAGDRR